MGVVPDCRQLGKAAATIIHVGTGAEREAWDMPVQADRIHDLKIDAGATARLLGITIPEPVREAAMSSSNDWASHFYPRECG